MVASLKILLVVLQKKRRPNDIFPDCRVITAGGAGSLGGSYTLQVTGYTLSLALIIRDT